MKNQADTDKTRAWLTLTEAQDRLITSSSDDILQARGKLCQAIAKLRLEVRVKIEGLADAALGNFETNDVDIPAVIFPDEIDWATSRPIREWRINTVAEKPWSLQRVTRLLVLEADVLANFCEDVSVIWLPDDHEIPPSNSSENSDYWRGFEEREWIPHHNAAEIFALQLEAWLPLSEAISLMAFGSPTVPGSAKEIEVLARSRQAARLLCGQLECEEVRGTHDLSSDSLTSIYWAEDWTLGTEPDSIVPIYQPRKIPTPLARLWFNVRVNTAAWRRVVKERIRARLTVVGRVPIGGVAGR